ncbi:hypothetical protein [Streptacidiphilus fuscans]|uniref:Secreted protein n=1 Tax=Streptacidiphilus fuscans TaxID=2789292 RepID=A0A931B6D1_9ACTN|nr:hypothetical protein [Streptacidiphilus fuscans]MBF9071259.1 hypothetical protein [Streptacidiphilus fuscans]
MSVKKIVTAAVLATAALASAAPASAADRGHVGPFDPPHPWDFSSAVSCFQQIAAVPVLGRWNDDHAPAPAPHCGG